MQSWKSSSAVTSSHFISVLRFPVCFLLKRGSVQIHKDPQPSSKPEKQKSRGFRNTLKNLRDRLRTDHKSLVRQIFKGVIGICPLLPALHAGSVNIDMMPDYSNSCFKEWVLGALLSLTCVCVFPCCASVFATVLSGIISLRMFDRRALLVIKSAMDNFLSTYWNCFSNGAGVQRSSRYTSGCYFPSCRTSHFWFGGLIGGSAGREPVFLRCFVSLGDRKWIFVFATLGSHVKAWKATAHHGRICRAAYPKVGTPGPSPPSPWASTLNCQQVLNELFCAEKPDIMFISETWQRQSHRLLISLCTSDLNFFLTS